MFRPVLGALFGAAALGLALPVAGAGGGVTITSYGHSALLIQGEAARCCLILINRWVVRRV